MTGTCKEWDDNKGYGTIAGDDGVNYFCHFSAVQSTTNKNLTVDEQVTFEPSNKTASGMNQATLVKRV
jgi:cold shock CspA family protein